MKHYFHKEFNKIKESSTIIVKSTSSRFGNEDDIGCMRADTGNDEYTKKESFFVNSVLRDLQQVHCSRIKELGREEEENMMKFCMNVSIK